MISDWDYFKRAHEGDESAWRILFKRHYSSLIKIVTLIIGCASSAEDLVQDTFFRLLHSKPKYFDGSFSAYLSTIAYRLALKEQKRQQRKRSESTENCIDGSFSPLEKIISDERDQEIAKVINSLPDNHKEILVLRFYGNHSYEEIAQITETPLGTVKSRIYYAVKSCRGKLLRKGII